MEISEQNLQYFKIFKKSWPLFISEDLAFFVTAYGHFGL